MAAEKGHPWKTGQPNPNPTEGKGSSFFLAFAATRLLFTPSFLPDMETNSDAEDQNPPATPEPSAPVTPETAPEAVAAEAPVAVEPEAAPVAEASVETPTIEAPAEAAAPEAPEAVEATTETTEEPEADGDIPAEEAPVEGAPAAEPDELDQLAEAAVKARLAMPQEERLTTLLKECLLGGRAGVARAVTVLPKVPWIVGVRAVEQTWPELTAGFRTQLLAGLAKDESDSARRIRLSLARALFKIEVPVALKLALGALKDFRDKTTGELTPKNAQIISNVFIGRGKPWLAQLPLAELKPAELDLLVNCAIMAAFMVPHPPVTQLGVIKWAQEANRLVELQGTALEVLLKGVARWSAKWQNALRKEVANLPENILAVLKPVAPETPAPAPVEEAAPEAAESADKDDDEDDDDEDEDEDDEDDDGEEDDEDDEDDDEDEESAPKPPRKERPVYEPRPQKPIQGGDQQQKERPVYTPRNQGNVQVPRNFNLNETLRIIEAHVQGLRSELSTAQSKARQKDDDRRRRGGDKSGPIIEGEPTIEELARLNLQLESRNAELQSRIDELTQHSEDVAASMGAMNSEPVTDLGDQLRTLLGLKLQDDYADFLALEQESHDLVVQQHYRTIIRHLFEVLAEAKVPLQVPEERQQA